MPSSLSQIGDEDVRELLGVIAACSLIKTYFLVSAGERYESEELSIDKYNQIKYNTKNYLEEYASLKRLVESKYNIEEHESKALFETTNGKMLALLTENGEKKQFKEKNEYLKSLHSSHYNIIYSSECNNKLSPLVSSMKFNNEHSG
ncbi:hypothetical protein TDB9533_04822 [Thalassocella blandensis]|nr:hypothetical protein TDB9533_04822 [Thalassocella blandensis]